MKELENKSNESMEVVKQRAVKKEIKLIGSQLKVPGHTLFEYNTITKELSIASYKKQDLLLESLNIHSLKINHKIDFKEGCIYVQALNKKNAIKRLIRDYQQSINPKEVNNGN